MTEEQKKQVKADLHSGAARLAASANQKAKQATGWKKWLYAALAIIAGAVAFFTATGCTPEAARQAVYIHEVYHVLTDTECKLAQPDTEIELEESKK